MRRQDTYTLFGLVLSVVAVILTFLRVPSGQAQLTAWLQNPLCVPLASVIALLLLALVLVLPFVDLSALAQRLRSLLPRQHLERRSLLALRTTLACTPALLTAKGRDMTDTALRLIAIVRQSRLALLQGSSKGAGAGRFVPPTPCASTIIQAGCESLINRPGVNADR